MKRRGALLVLLVAAAWMVPGVTGCGPGRGAGRRRGPRKLTPLVFKQHVPNVSENTLTASGLSEGRIDKKDKRFSQDLVPNYNRDIIFKDEEGTGADRLMTQRCKEKLNTLAISVMNQWPGVRLRVTEGWDEEGHHASDSLHYEGRAVDITTSDRDRSKYGMLARLAVEAGFDWVYYASRAHIHCSVKSESSQAAKYGGCFTEDSTVMTPHGPKTMSQVQVGDYIQSVDPTTMETVFSEVFLFLDYDPEERRTFLRLHLRSGRILTVTPTHLILSRSQQDASTSTVRTIFADKLRVGDKLFTSALSTSRLQHFQEDELVHIEPVLRTGVYAPLTKAGTVVVDGVAASCYATIDSARLAHWVFAPLRLLFNLREGATRLWHVVRSPLDVWHSAPTKTKDNFVAPLADVDVFSNEIDSISERNATSWAQKDINRSIGVHWYARVLYMFGDVLIPSHMRT